MSSRYSRAHEKFSDAVYRLATGEKDVRDRLRRAYTPLNRLHANELPADLQEEWGAILREMTKLGPERWRDEIVDSAINHTMSRIRNSTGRKLAERIYRLNSELIWLVERQKKRQQ